MLSVTVFLPLLGALLLWLLPVQHARWVNLVANLFVFVQTVLIAMAVGSTGYSHVENISWIPAFYDIRYHVGVDGLGASLLLLTAFVSTVGVFASWKIDKSVRGYHAMYLLLLTGMLGVFVALDLFLFYLFWELMLLPMYFLIGIWGGPRRQYAAIKFFLYTLFGSVLLLAGVILVVLEHQTWQIPELIEIAHASGGLLAGGLGTAAFIMMFIGFAVKIPAFPFHTWLPDAHVEAPTPISMILAGVLLKMGGYGLMRVAYPFFPDAAADAGWWVSTLSVIAIVYGALVAMAQTDLKKLIAYSSVSHMGFVTLGLASGTAEGWNGAMYMMLAHGTISAMLFMIVGVIYDRAHHRDIDRFGGLAWTMPRYAALASFAFFASLGLPGLSGFVAEIMTFIGAFNGAHRWAAIVSLLGVVFTAAYYLITLQKVYLGDTPAAYKDKAHYPDVSKRELGVLMPLAVVTLIMGVLPALALNLYKDSLDDMRRSPTTSKAAAPLPPAPAPATPGGEKR
jgi:NADH-quinone oxidoreductase subunit M